MLLCGCSSAIPTAVVTTPPRLPVEVFDVRTSGLSARSSQAGAVAVFELGPTGRLSFLGQGVVPRPVNQTTPSVRIPIDSATRRTGRGGLSLRQVPRWTRRCADPDGPDRCRWWSSGATVAAADAGRAGYWLVLLTPAPFDSVTLTRALARIEPEPVPARLARQLVAALPVAGGRAWGYVVIPIP